MSPVQDIINFAAKLAACQAIVERADSLEQAIKESEVRLDSARHAEYLVNDRVRLAEARKSVV